MSRSDILSWLTRIFWLAVSAVHPLALTSGSSSSALMASAGVSG